MKRKFTFIKTMLLALLVMAGSVSAWGQTSTSTVTINATSAGGADNLGNGNYGGGAERTWTQDGLNLASKAVTVGNQSPNVGKLQAQANNGVIYNTVALPGRLVSITLNGTGQSTTLHVRDSRLVNNAAGNYTVNGGESKGAKSDDVSKWTMDEEDEYYFFAIKRGAKAEYWTSIVIEYEEAGEATCTSPELAFSNTVVDKTVVDAAFSNLANSLNETTAITYSSSNTDVATVNATTGEVTIVDAGTAIITASQEAGTHDGTEYCVASATYTLHVDPLPAPVASDATPVGGTKFTANWSAVAGATAYILEVDKIEGDALLDEDFSGLTAGDNTTSGGSGTGWSGNDNFLTVVAAYQAGGAVRLGTSKAIGSITSKEIDLSEGVTLSFDVKGWSTVEGDIEVSVNGTVVSTETYTATMSGNFETIVVELPAATNASTITLATTAKRAFLDNIKVGSIAIPVTGSPFTIAAPDVSYQVTGIEKESHYVYRVKAISGDFESAWSEEITVNTNDGTDVNSIQAIDHLYSTNGNIHFQAVAGETVEVYNVAGQKLATRIATEGLNTLPVNVQGVVIVKVGNKVGKTIIR